MVGVVRVATMQSIPKVSYKIKKRFPNYVENIKTYRKLMLH